MYTMTPFLHGKGSITFVHVSQHPGRSFIATCLHLFYRSLFLLQAAITKSSSISTFYVSSQFRQHDARFHFDNLLCSLIMVLGVQ